MPLSPTAKRCLAVLQLLNEESAQADEMGNARPILAAGFTRSNSNVALEQNDVSAFARPGLPGGQPSYLGEMGTVVSFAPASIPPGQDNIWALPSSALQGQDFTWFDSLPTDLLAIDDAELLNLPQWSQD